MDRIGRILDAADVVTLCKQFDKFEHTEFAISRCLDAFDAALEDLEDDDFAILADVASAWVDTGTIMCDLDGEIGQELHESDELNRVPKALIGILEELGEEDAEDLTG